jgi:hypothetical protein
MTDDDETIALRVTVIGGKRWPDDFTVIWRGLPIGRIMLAPGLPSHAPQNFDFLANASLCFTVRRVGRCLCGLLRSRASAFRRGGPQA